MIYTRGRQREAASLDLHARRGKDFSATPKPCSNNKQPENSKGPFFSSTQSTVTFMTTQEASWRRDTVRCGSHGTPLVGGFGDTNRLSVGPLRTWCKRPICHAERGPVRLCEQAFGTTGTLGATNRTVRRGWGGFWGSKCTAGWTTSVTPCFRFPWRQDRTPPPPHSTPIPIPPARAALTHHALTAW